MTAQLDHSRIQVLLEHFKNLPPENIDQEQGIIYTHNGSSSLLCERDACIGANAVMALGYPPQESKLGDSRFWAFHDAPKALGQSLCAIPRNAAASPGKTGRPDGAVRFR